MLMLILFIYLQVACVVCLVFSLAWQPVVIALWLPAVVVGAVSSTRSPSPINSIQYSTVYRNAVCLLELLRSCLLEVGAA